LNSGLNPSQPDAVRKAAIIALYNSLPFATKALEVFFFFLVRPLIDNIILKII
jgi:hypothetical protein